MLGLRAKLAHLALTRELLPARNRRVFRLVQGQAQDSQSPSPDCPFTRPDDSRQVSQGRLVFEWARGHEGSTLPSTPSGRLPTLRRAPRQRASSSVGTSNLRPACCGRRRRRAIIVEAVGHLLADEPDGFSALQLALALTTLWRSSRIMRRARRPPSHLRLATSVGRRHRRARRPRRQSATGTRHPHSNRHTVTTFAPSAFPDDLQRTQPDACDGLKMRRNPIVTGIVTL
jgi:hypothetical protein